MDQRVKGALQKLRTGQEWAGLYGIPMQTCYSYSTATFGLWVLFLFQCKREILRHKVIYVHVVSKWLS